MAIRWMRGTAATIASVLASLTAAMAQQAVIEGVTVEQQIRAAGEAQRVRAAEDKKKTPQTLPGETGVFVLIKRDIFSVRAGLGGGHTSNAAKNDLGKSDSAFATAYVDLAVDTRIGGAVNAGARLSFSQTRYADFSSADNSTALFSTYISETIFGGVIAQATMDFGFQFAAPLRDATFFASGALSASRPFALSPRVIVTPFAFAGITGSQTSELANYTFGAGLNATILTPMGLTLTSGIRYSHVIFPDFFEDVTLVNRSDNRVQLSLGARYWFSRAFQLSANGAYVANSSTLDLSDYESFDLVGMLQAELRF